MQGIVAFAFDEHTANMDGQRNGLDSGNKGLINEFLEVNVYICCRKSWNSLEIFFIFVIIHFCFLRVRSFTTMHKIW